MCLISLRKPKLVLFLLLPWFIESHLRSEEGGLSAYQLGMRYLSQQEHHLAEKSFLQALQDPAAPVETHFKLAWVYTSTGDWKKAEEKVPHGATSLNTCESFAADLDASGSRGRETNT